MQRPATFLSTSKSHPADINHKSPSSSSSQPLTSSSLPSLFYLLLLIWLGRRIRKVKVLKLALRGLIQLLLNSPVKWQQLYFIKADTWPSAKQLCSTLNANECFSRTTGPGCYHHNVRILDFQQFHMCLEKFPQ